MSQHISSKALRQLGVTNTALNHLRAANAPRSKVLATKLFGGHRGVALGVNADLACEKLQTFLAQMSAAQTPLEQRPIMLVDYLVDTFSINPDETARVVFANFAD